MEKIEYFLIGWSIFGIFYVFLFIAPIDVGDAKFISGNYTIEFFGENWTYFEAYEHCMAYNYSNSWSGFTRNENDIHIKNGFSRLHTVGICWHEKMHNTLNYLNLTLEGEHEIIYSQIPNYFDEDCLFIWGLI